VGFLRDSHFNVYHGTQHISGLSPVNGYWDFMKLRIKGNSLRLRVSPPELARFLDGERIEETIHFSRTPEASLTYVLESAVQVAPVRVRYESQIVKVILSEDQAGIWGTESEVGVYSTLDIGAADSLEVIVEKDFVCLDRSDEENSDAFANPQAAARC
jgi:hypothetical protein